MASPSGNRDLMAQEVELQKKILSAVERIEKKIGEDKGGKGEGGSGGMLAGLLLGLGGGGGSTSADPGGVSAGRKLRRQQRQQTQAVNKQAAAAEVQAEAQQDVGTLLRQRKWKVAAAKGGFRGRLGAADTYTMTMDRPERTDKSKQSLRYGLRKSRDKADAKKFATSNSGINLEGKAEKRSRTRSTYEAWKSKESDTPGKRVSNGNRGKGDGDEGGSGMMGFLGKAATIAALTKGFKDTWVGKAHVGDNLSVYNQGQQESNQAQGGMGGMAAIAWHGGMRTGVLPRILSMAIPGANMLPVPQMAVPGVADVTTWIAAIVKGGA